jgi:acyl-homoserine lactone acylase PvdQ
METFDAGTLNGKPVRYPVSVHGPMIGTATVDGQPVALTRKRSTFGRDGLNLAALKDMTEGKADTPNHFFDTANQFEFTFNWAYASRKETAFFSSGRMPVRPSGLDRRLPTLGDGTKEWTGFLSERQHPHDVSGPRGLLLNWNNQSAPGFLHSDGKGAGSVHRVELFDRFPRRVQLTDDVGVMNRAATEDARSLVWPVVRQVLAKGRPPSTLARDLVSEIDRWVAQDAPRLDADDDGTYDAAGPTIMDALWRPVADTVMRPVFGNLTDRLGLNGLDGESYVDKDLRTLLGQKVRGKFNLRYCGNGSLSACRASLWAAVDQTASALATQFGNQNPSSWLKEAALTSFVPGILTTKFRSTNRPTFQQVLEFQHERGWGR